MSKKDIKYMKEYGILYTKICFPRGHKLEWLNYCALTNVLTKELQKEISILSNKINEEYKSDIIVPMDNRINPGCISTPESVEKISNSIYSGFVEILKKISKSDSNNVRVVYGVGQIENIENLTSLHKESSSEIVFKIGKYIDSSNDSGVFKV